MYDKIKSINISLFRTGDNDFAGILAVLTCGKSELIKKLLNNENSELMMIKNFFIWLDNQTSLVRNLIRGFIIYNVFWISKIVGILIFS